MIDEKGNELGQWYSFPFSVKKIGSCKFVKWSMLFLLLGHIDYTICADRFLLYGQIRRVLV